MNVNNDKLQQVAQVADALSSAGNQARYRDINEILEAVSRLHRTEKQNLGSLVFALIGEWSRDYENGNYDARNEATCRMAFAMVQGLPEGERGDFWMPSI
jgi:sulfatase maturation enzyme AslB (radical SAM superfamily)